MISIAVFNTSHDVTETLSSTKLSVLFVEVSANRSSWMAGINYKYSSKLFLHARGYMRAL